MNRNDFDNSLAHLIKSHEALLTQTNPPQPGGNGIFQRYVHPVLTAEHTPLEWRYDFDPATNPHLMTRLGINSAFNVGAMEFEG